MERLFNNNIASEPVKPSFGLLFRLLVKPDSLMPKRKQIWSSVKYKRKSSVFVNV
jgi:hypothetical protein